MQELIAKLEAFVAERDWERYHAPKNLAMALSVEVAEIVEIFQWMPADQSRAPDAATREHLRDEIGDVLIYLTMLARKLDIDPLEAAHAKLEKPAEISGRPIAIESPHDPFCQSGWKNSARRRPGRPAVHAGRGPAFHPAECLRQAAGAGFPGLGYRFLPFPGRGPDPAHRLRTPAQPLPRAQRAAADHPRVHGFGGLYRHGDGHSTPADFHGPCDFLFLSGLRGPVLLFLYGEKIRLLELVCILAVLAGVAVLFDFQLAGDLFGQAMALVGGALAGLTVTLIRTLRADNGPVIIYLYLCTMGLMVTLPAFALGPVWPTSSWEWGLVLGIIFSSVTAQLLMNQGFFYCRGWEGGVFMSSEVIFTALVGTLFMGDPTTWRFWLGGGLIFGSVVALNRLKSKPA